MKRAILTAFLLAIQIGPVSLVAADQSASTKRVLVYTHNGTGGSHYVHDNIAASVAAIKKMGAENGFAVDASDDPNVFTPANLKQYNAIVFSNSNNEAFLTESQREAFKNYMDHGGNFVGIHSASGSERQWPYFWSVLGGTFVRHPKQQTFVVRVVDPNNPATKGLPKTFEWNDECYYLDHLSPNIHPLLVTDPLKLEDPDEAKYPGDKFGDAMPLAWTQNLPGGGRSFYVALGHNKEYYENPTLVHIIRGGILWALGSR